MQYRAFPNTDVSHVSALGMGCMRLPTQPVEGNPIDRPEAIRLIRKAIDSGVTYVDTAYGYHGGDSERLVGEALRDGYRERVTLATKLPVWLVEKYEDMERLLDEQLARLQVSYVDFYLLHALNKASFEKVRDLGAFKFLDEMKAKGKIRFPAFSFHDNAEVFRQIVDSYPWSMAQVQMNVLDEFHQATMEGIRYAASKGIGIVVMEPLRGGALARNIPDEIQALYDAQPVRRSAAEWAFRWLYEKPEFITILSGMSSMEQLEQNLASFEDAIANSVPAEEIALLEQVRDLYEKRIRVGCTGCEYCMPCPAGIHIPEIFRSLDEAVRFNSVASFAKSYPRRFVEKGIGADKCLSCGKCEKACPQKIEIRRHMKEIDAEFNV